VTYLLDTHVWLWMLTEPHRVGGIEALLRNDENVPLLSAVSAWEIAIKDGLGRLPLPEPPRTFRRGSSARAGRRSPSTMSMCSRPQNYLVTIAIPSIAC
jgi:PIN domain nuclease of toxin-antitoxin system